VRTLSSVLVSNVLSEEQKQQVIALGRLGWSLRRIERETGVRRETISAYLKEAGVEMRPPRGRRLPAKPASRHTGVTPDLEVPEPAGEVTPDSPPAKPASQAEEVTTDSGGESVGETTATPEPKPGRSPSASACEPYEETIEAGLARGRNAKAIWQDLVDVFGFAGGYQSVKRFIRKFRGQQQPEACAVIETAPGEELQVDYGSGPMVRDVQSGKYRRTRLFVTLGYSRKSVRLMVFGSSSQTWAELHEKALRRLGGVTRVVVLDNLREGVLKPDIYDPIVNPLYHDMLRHYNVVALPCRVRDPDRKAYVSYYSSSRLCNGENWLLGPAPSVTLENRVLVQRFVEAALGIVVAVLLQSTLSRPEVYCSRRHAVPHAHFFGCEQSPGSQPAVTALQMEGLPNVRNLLQVEGFTLPSPAALAIENFSHLAITVMIQQPVDLGDHVRLGLANLRDRQRFGES
jgi:transposase